MMALSKRQNGFTLVEALIGLAIGFISMLAFSSLLFLQTDVQNRSQGRTDFAAMLNDVRTILSDPNLCTQAFTGAGVILPTVSTGTINMGFNGAGGLNLSAFNPNNQYFSVTITQLQITNTQTPTCTGCQFHRSFDLNIAATSPTDPKLNSRMSVLVQVDATNHILSCLDSDSLQQQEVCTSMGQIWDTSVTPPRCMAPPRIDYVQQGTVILPPQASSNPVVLATIPAGQYAMCYLTGILGGGENSVEGVQISGSCQAGFTITGWNRNNPTHTFDWACIRQTCP